MTDPAQGDAQALVRQGARDVGRLMQQRLAHGLHPRDALGAGRAANDAEDSRHGPTGKGYCGAVTAGLPDSAGAAGAAGAELRNLNWTHLLRSAAAHLTSPAGM